MAASYKSKQLGRQGWIRPVGFRGPVLSVPHTCLIKLLPGPGPGEQVWSKLEEEERPVGAG